MAKDKLQTLADQLEQAMDLQERIEAELTPVKEQVEKIRAELTKTLLKKGWNYVKATSGLGFGIVKGKVSYSIKKSPGMREKAVKWAQDNFPSILSISAADLNKVLGGKFAGTKSKEKIPDFFERKESEPHLSVRTSEDEAITR